MNKTKTVNVDEIVLKSLKMFFFGPYDDIREAAIRRAYLDVCRTIRFDKTCLQTIKNNAFNTLVFSMKCNLTTLHHLIKGNKMSQQAFDNWHKQTAENLISIYSIIETDFSYGQAQKWINMTTKYLYILGDRDIESLFMYLHVPVDNIILNVASKQFNINKPKKAWSRWNENDYYQFQLCLRNAIGQEAPLRWEMSAWLSAR